MKNVLIIALIMFGTIVYGQEKKMVKNIDKTEMREKMKDLSPEQMAELHTKKLVLHLDLTDAQQKKLYPILLVNAKERKAKMEKRNAVNTLTKDELFAARNARLDAQIAFKQEMKSVLSEEQFAKWEKGMQHRGKAHKGKGSKGKM